MTYNYRELVDGYKSLGLERGDIVSVLSAVWLMKDFVDAGINSLVESHFNALREIIGDEGTIVVPTTCLNLCNTEIVFDLDKTPSWNVGVLSEHIRQTPLAKRSFHPFGSYTAYGSRATEIVANVSRHMYGPETPEARMIEFGGKAVNIGLPPNITATVHHVEQVMGVPYRYTKEFNHPVLRNGEVSEELFYLHVHYIDIGMVRDNNKKLFAAMEGKLKIHEARVGRGRLYAYDLQDFYRESTRAFVDDMYIWVKFPPPNRPYQGNLP